jgi:hypothetical protein
VKRRHWPSRRRHRPAPLVPTHSVPSGSASSTSTAGAGWVIGCGTHALPSQRASPAAVPAHTPPSAPAASARVMGSGKPSLVASASRRPGGKRTTPARLATQMVPSAVSSRSCTYAPGEGSPAGSEATWPSSRRRRPRPNEPIQSAPSFASCRARTFRSTMPGRRCESKVAMRCPSKRTRPSDVPSHRCPSRAGRIEYTDEACATLGQAVWAYWSKRLPGWRAPAGRGTSSSSSVAPARPLPAMSRGRAPQPRRGLASRSSTTGPF